MSRPRTQPLAFFVAGTGAVGVGLAGALGKHGCFITGLFNRGEPRRRSAEALLGVPVSAALGEGLAEAELVLVCVGDAAVPALAGALAQSGRLQPGTVVAHTSGCLPSTALGDLGTGVLRGSLHPLVALPEPARAAAALEGAAFAVEGEPRAVELLEEAVGALRGRSFRVRTEAKPRYHAAAVMASNLVVALLAEAIDAAAAAGVADARELLGELAAGAVANVARTGAVAALTGPVLRGDIETVAAHLAALGPEARDSYRVLSRRALALARQRGLDAESAAALERLLALPGPLGDGC